MKDQKSSNSNIFEKDEEAKDKHNGGKIAKTLEPNLKPQIMKSSTVDVNKNKGSKSKAPVPTLKLNQIKEEFKDDENIMLSDKYDPSKDVKSFRLPYSKEKTDKSIMNQTIDID